MAKKIRIKKPLNEVNTTGRNADKSRISYDKVDDIMRMWDDIKGEEEKRVDKEIKDRQKKYGLNSTRKVDVSKIDAIEITKADGSKEIINPRQIAFYTRLFINELQNDANIRPMAKYFNKDIIWTFDIGTAATDGIRIAMNPAFVDELLSIGMGVYKQEKKMNPSINPDKYIGRAVQFVFMHEAYHQIYRHTKQEKLKRETADGSMHDLANISQDVEINRDIEAQFPERFAGITQKIQGMWDDAFPTETWDKIFDAYYSGQNTPPNMRPQGNHPGKNNPKQKGNSSQGQGQSGQQNNQQQGQSGQQGSQSQSGNQSGQQGNQNNGNQSSQGNNGPDKNGLNKKSPDYLKGYEDALKDILSGKIQINAFMNEAATGIANQADYDQGYQDAIEAYKALKAAAQEAMNNQNSGQNSNSHGQQGSQNGQDGEQSGADNQSNGGSQSGSAGNNDGSGPMGKIDGSTLEMPDNPTTTGKFNMRDLLSTEEMQALAEAAGQPYDSEDLSTDPIKKADDYVRENKKAMIEVGKKQPGHGRGTSLDEKLLAIDALFQPKVNWKRKLQPFLNALVKHDDELQYSRKRLTSTDPDMEMGRYTKPNLKTSYKNEGITQIFHLMDNSGSMYGQMSRNGSGEEIFQKIFGEIIAMERKAHIQKSSAAFFCSGLTAGNIISWCSEKMRGPQVFKLLDKARKVEGYGGTEIAPAFASIQKIGKPYYSKHEPATLMLIYTDGELVSRDYQYFSELPFSIKKNVIFMVLNNSDSSIENTKKRLTGAGIKESHIIGINTKEYDD